MAVKSDEVLPFAIHEAGHYVVGTILRFKQEKMTINIISAREHSANAVILLGEGLDSLENVVDYCERRIKVLYAGAIAEAKFRNKLSNEGVDEILAYGGGKSDFDKARELFRFHRGIRHPKTTDMEESDKQLLDLGNEMINAAVEIVEDNYETILSLGNELAKLVQKYGKEYILERNKIEEVPLYKELLDKLSTPDPGTAN